MKNEKIPAFTPAFGLPHKVNFHLWKPCNERCGYCFATFKDVHGHLSWEDCIAILTMLRDARVSDINFAGGEPTLYPSIAQVIEHSRKLGFDVSITTNGSRLRELFDACARCLTAVAISVDSGDEKTQQDLGRGNGSYVRQSLELFGLVHKLGIHAKLNSVIAALNCSDDMSEFVLQARPRRWKIFQVLRVEGQNDKKFDNLGISDEQFAEFVSRHNWLKDEGIELVPETNDLMTGSYAMIDPIGRFYSNVGGHHTYSDPILKVGVEEAFKQVEFRQSKFVERGGTYQWVPLGIRAKAG
jgi:radical S-adenosyl methionine domain-containing protein 2